MMGWPLADASSDRTWCESYNGSADAILPGRRCWEPGDTGSLLDMLTVAAVPFVRAISTLERIHFALSPIDKSVGAVSPVLINSLLRASEDLLASVGEMDLFATTDAIRDLQVQVGLLGDPDGETVPVAPGEIEKILRTIHEIRSRMHAELKGTAFFIMTRSERKMFNPDGCLFGDEVGRQFPGLCCEIKEAGKCLALERSTASAFHSIRCLEAAVRAISRCLGIPDPTRQSDRSWFKMLAAIDAQIKAKWPTAADRMNGDGREFEEMHATLAAIQNPYRNATMHLDSTYTTEGAKVIMEWVKHFLQRVARRMDENGSPLAR